ncbi:hypothetical protein C0J52_14368 [Blattella germanica]|nr:hypothetical protein C0J52_14368 [Blattella germanica]
MGGTCVANGARKLFEGKPEGCFKEAKVLKGPYELLSRLEGNEFCFHKYLWFLFQIHNSTASQVVLKTVNLSSTGRYRCEVSAEAPSFQTVSDHGDMTVVGEYHFLFLYFLIWSTTSFLRDLPVTWFSSWNNYTTRGSIS